MLGSQQLEDLLGWLETEKGRLKVLVSSVPFTRNWRGVESRDSWAGYLWERERVLEGMWRTEGVVVISGVSFAFPFLSFLSPVRCVCLYVGYCDVVDKVSDAMLTVIRTAMNMLQRVSLLQMGSRMSLNSRRRH